MSVNIIFYFEDDTGIEISTAFIDQMVAMYGYQWFMIDRTGTKRGERVFSSLDQAIRDSRFADYTWVYFDINATNYLEDFTHPVDNIVYVIGSDTVGYDGKSIKERNGKSLKLKTKDLNREYYASAIISYVMSQRWHKTGGN